MKFAKGQPRPPGSGRKPGSRNRATADIKALAQAHGAEAIAKLAELMRTGGEKTRIAAARELLDRGYGRATVRIEDDAGNAMPLVTVYLPDNGRG